MVTDMVALVSADKYYVVAWVSQDKGFMMAVVSQDMFLDASGRNIDVPW